MINIEKLKGHLNEVKGKFKQKIALLFNDDYLLVEGKEDEIIGRIQARSGKSKQEVLKYISEL